MMWLRFHDKRKRMCVCSMASQVQLRCVLKHVNVGVLLTCVSFAHVSTFVCLFLRIRVSTTFRPAGYASLHRSQGSRESEHAVQPVAIDATPPAAEAG